MFSASRSYSSRTSCSSGESSGGERRLFAEADCSIFRVTTPGLGLLADSRDNI